MVERGGGGAGDVGDGVEGGGVVSLFGKGRMCRAKLKWYSLFPNRGIKHVDTALN